MPDSTVMISSNWLRKVLTCIRRKEASQSVCSRCCYCCQAVCPLCTVVPLRLLHQCSEIRKPQRLNLSTERRMTAAHLTAHLQIRIQYRTSSGPNKRNTI